MHSHCQECLKSTDEEHKTSRPTDFYRQQSYRTQIQTYSGQESRKCPQKLELIAPVFIELSCKHEYCYYIHTYYIRTDGNARYYIPGLAYRRWRGIKN